jgi:hypothetical protein
VQVHDHHHPEPLDVLLFWVCCVCWGWGWVVRFVGGWWWLVARSTWVRGPFSFFGKKCGIQVGGQGGGRECGHPPPPQQMVVCLVGV